MYDSNAPALTPLVREAGAVVERTPVLDDEQEVQEEALRAAAGTSEVVVVTGGSSVGERDLLAPVMERLGSVEFHGVAIKPGKPVLFGRLDDTLVLGLPGNPTSCLLSAWLFLRPALRRMARLPPEPQRCRQAKLTAPVQPVLGRDQLMMVRLEVAGDEGRLLLRLLAWLYPRLGSAGRDRIPLRGVGPHYREATGNGRAATNCDGP